MDFQGGTTSGEITIWGVEERLVLWQSWAVDFQRKNALDVGS
jgi:hypothetical protein